MFEYNVPKLTNEDLNTGIEKALNSDRNRYPLILHEKGDEFNQVFNFVAIDSYMQPHLHPGKEKIEKMHLIKGSFELLIFDNNGFITDRVLIEENKKDYIEVPAFTWHTYIMKSEVTVIFETMMGVYDPKTWKKLANWAPDENSAEAKTYLSKLRKN